MTNNAFTLEDALYGLRNLSVGDDEETRIADYQELSDELRKLIDDGDCVTAYRRAIAQALTGMTRDEVQAAVTSWIANVWNTSEQGGDNPYDITTDELMAEYDAMIEETHGTNGTV